MRFRSENLIRLNHILYAALRYFYNIAVAQLECKQKFLRDHKTKQCASVHFIDCVFIFVIFRIQNHFPLTVCMNLKYSAFPFGIDRLRHFRIAFPFQEGQKQFRLSVISFQIVAQNLTEYIHRHIRTGPAVRTGIAAVSVRHRQQDSVLILFHFFQTVLTFFAVPDV